MNLLIDASNIQTGGGLTHLLEILKFARPSKFKINKVIVCASSKVLNQMENHEWLTRHSHNLLEGGYLKKWIWANFILPALIKEEKAFPFFIGTIKPGFIKPYATICQNLLPIELRELKRFGFSATTLRLLLLRLLHFQSYRHAKGVIFLTQYSYNALPPSVKKGITQHTIIPHGLNRNYFYIRNFNTVQTQVPRRIFRLLYVSIINEYKHQDKVVQAVINLNKKGYTVKLTLVGPSYTPSLRKIKKILFRQSDFSYCVEYKGFVPYEKQYFMYSRHDASIFASSCETFGMIVTEGMAMGCPVLCSNKSSLPETVGEAGIYFDPENIVSIEEAVIKVYHKEDKLKELSTLALARSQKYSWEQCSNDTFEFISGLMQNKN